MGIYSDLDLYLDLIRLRPRNEDIDKKFHQDRLTDIIIALLIFSLAMWFRLYIRHLLIPCAKELGCQEDLSFNYQITENDPLGLSVFFGVPTGTYLQSEGYNDFHHYYLDYVNAFVDGWNPYSGHIQEDDVLNAYVYGPFYIYIISLGSLMFGLDAYDSIMYGNIITDALTFVMVYILGKKVTGSINSMILSIIGSISPITIFFGTIRLLNSPQMNLIFLIAIYFYIEHKDTRTVLFMAIATLTKQFPLFFMMPLGLWFIRRYGFFKATNFVLKFFVFSIILSLPWILYTPDAYISKLFLARGGKNGIYCAGGGETTNLVHSFLSPEICQQYGEGGNNLIPNQELSSTIIWINFLVNSHILFYVCISILSFVGFTAYDYFENKPRLYYVFITAFFFIVHGTVARGIFKYYLTFLTPLFLLSIMYGNPDESLNINIGKGLSSTFSQWIDPKNRIGPATIKYWSVILILISIIAITFKFISYLISLFAPTVIGFWWVILIPFIFIALIKPGYHQKNQKNTVLTNKNDMIKVAISNLVAILIILGIIKLFDEKVLWFSKDKNLEMNTIYLYTSIFLILLASLNFLNKFFLKKSKFIPIITYKPSRVLSDVILTFVGLMLFFFFNREIFLIQKRQASGFVLLFGILFCGMLGEEVWQSAIKVPKEVRQRVKEFKLIRDTSNKSKI